MFPEKQFTHESTHICVCMWFFFLIYVYMRVYSCVLYMCLCLSVCMCVYVSVCMCLSACTCLCLSVCIGICVFMPRCVYECVCMYAYAYECAHIQSSRWVTPLHTLPTAFQHRNRQTLMYTFQMNRWVRRKGWVVWPLCLRLYSENQSVDPSSILQPPILYLGVSEIHCVERQVRK